VQNNSFVDLVDTRVQGGRTADVEIKYFGTGLIADGEKITEASRNKESNLHDGWDVHHGGFCEIWG
jgi:hypothetical protein